MNEFVVVGAVSALGAFVALGVVVVAIGLGVMALENKLDSQRHH